MNKLIIMAASSSMDDVLSSSSDSSGTDTEGAVEPSVSASSASISVNFSEVLSKMCREELVVRSTKGPHIIKYCNSIISNYDSGEVRSFSKYISDRVVACFKIVKEKGKNDLWRNYHVLSLSKDLRARWQRCVESLGFHDESSITDTVLQAILRRLMKNVIHVSTPSQPMQAVESKDLTVRELNITRYVAGYVVLKLKRKFPKYLTMFNNHLIDSGLHQYVNIASIEDYSRVWLEQVDRGGLCSVSDDFFEFLKRLEQVCRKYLDVRVAPVERLTQTITEDVVSCADIRDLWQQISQSAQESDNIAILRFIVSLWLTTRVHAFTAQWSDAILAAKKAGFKKALRPTLQSRGTEKDPEA